MPYRMQLLTLYNNQLTFYAYVGVLEMQQAITRVQVGVDGYDPANTAIFPVASTTILRPKA